ncbi:Ig-like domain (group 3) [Granulicella rosea]|uniref:Ig-like domain (Group 3) n=1 Tax=Granulicella rosea TaxID=474952 RepID=A0A239CV39_9BACT|nr:pectinesterase family protein [Granulicella rosea]SNS24096.1 Ig-like domain (group 3) [Granulicella rosea]
MLPAVRLACRSALALALGLLLVAPAVVPSASAQTPVILPSTVTSIAGNTPTASTVGAACPTNAQFTATDTLGNGCPAVNAVFAGNERSMVVDPQGNVYVIADTTNPQAVRRIDARTGNISIFAGAGSGGCGASSTVYGTVYSATDKVGDGCPAYNTGGFNGGRGLGMDPYGNLIITVTGDQALHFVCNNVSPLCTAAQARVNYMRNIAGCTPSTSGYGTTVSGATVGSAGDGTLATQFSGTCTVGVNAPRQAAGDRWENVYFSDNSNNRIRVVLGAPSITVNGVAVANPLYAALALNSSYATPTQGYIYPMAGGGTACSAKTDAGGDGCPYYQTVVGSTTTVAGLAVDNDGDFLFADGLGRLRTVYMGGTAIKAALAANGILAPQVGYSYALIGNGLGASGATGGTFLYYNSNLSGTYLGTSYSLQASAQRIAVDAAGNVYIGDQAQVLFYDIFTGYVRRLGGGTTATSCNSSSIGDGCPIAQSLFGAANSVLSVGLDNLGNLYIQDLTNKLIRRVSATALPTAAVNGSLTSNLVVHAPSPSSTVAVSAPASAEFSLGSTTCAAANSDGTVDCFTPVTYTPKALAQRTEPVAIATTVGGTTTTKANQLTSLATGSALVFDLSGTPSTSVLGAGTTGSTAVVLDGAGNAYVTGTQGISKVSGSTVTSVSATPASYIAVDAQGNVYAANASGVSIAKYSYNAATGTYSSGTVTIPLIPINGSSVQGGSGPMTVDANGNIYIADLTNKQVIRFSQTANVGQQLTQTALGSPTAITQDYYGNLLVIDGTSVLKIPASGLAISTSSPIASPRLTFPTALVAPTAIAVDQGENVYVADSGNILALSLSGYQYTIPGISGSGVAVDGAGNLYTTSSTVAGITQVARNAESYNFGTNVSTAYVGVFLNTGATAATGFNQTDTGGNFSALAPATPLATSGPTCNLASTALAGGALCNVSIKFAPTASGNGVVTDAITLLPASNTLGGLTVSGTKNGSTATTTTAITGNTAGLIYSTGTETTFTVTLTQSAGAPAGNVSVSIDGGTAVAYPLTAATASTATATVPIAGLIATSHTIAATYGGSSGIAGSSSPITTFSIAPATTSVTWNPGATTQPFSAAIGTSVLNASGFSGSTSVPGAVVYTATPSGGSAAEIHSASYLAIGSYSLTATFYPTDSVDYTGSTASVASYTVTKANTSAPVGASQMLVASDGTGNYTTVQAAVNALGTTGGSVYIKPGTYTGFVAVVQPNVSLRGLGGDPTQVILTKNAGAFSVAPGTGNGYAGEFTSANTNGAQLASGSTVFAGDEGSATLIVAKGINSSISTSTLTPNNFYSENLSLINTWNTDTTTTTTTYLSGSACTANAGVARTYSDLYNSGLECASQALAIWTTSDLAVMNNVYTASLQDTIYAGSQGAPTPARQYWFRGKVTGDVDYIFGDAAAVFDHSNIYTAFHGATASGTETIEAQNKSVRTGATGDYLSGYVMNGDTFTSQAPGMTGLYFGRPYGTYSTWIMLNSYVDQVSAVGYIEFSGDNNLPTSTYGEYNDLAYTDPATGAADANGVLYLGSGGSTGSGVTGTRETTSQSPGTPMANNVVRTSVTQAQAQAYYPTNFLGTTVSSSTTPNWNPTAALATQVNAFVPSGTSLSVNAGTSVTLLMRPQTPGLGAVTYGSYTVPTGSYTLTDTFGGKATVLQTGSLDAAGEAYYTSSALAIGVHSLTWSYSGDSNFNGSTTGTAYTLTVNGTTTSTTLSVNTASPAYGSAVSISATVSPATGSVTPTGSVVLTVDGATQITQTLAGGIASFSLTGLSAGNHTLSAAYSGDTTNNASTGTGSVSLTKAPLTVTGSSFVRAFETANPALSYAITGAFYNGDTASTAISGTASVSTTVVPNSPAGAYPVTVAAGTLSSTNYSFTYVNGTATVNGNAAQTILFGALPNIANGLTVPLYARALSGLPITYTVSGPASISGNLLTVTGTGSVTVTANQSGNTTFAAATSVSRSFTAQ